jgi:hypothetical protein
MKLKLDPNLPQSHFERRYQSTRRSHAFAAESPEAVQHWQGELRTVLIDLVGLPRIAETCGLDRPERPIARRIQEADTELGVVREEWELQVEDDVWLPFHLLRPLETSPDQLLPLVLCPHGHHPPGIYAGYPVRPGDDKKISEGQRDIAVQAAREGYLAIAPTTRAFGASRLQRGDLRQNETDWTCRTVQMQNLLLGRTLVGERVWDVSRLLDWALAELPVDPEAVILTGNSGGGTTTIHAAAIDERIGIALPASAFCTYAGSIGTVWHCECNYIPGILTHAEMWEVAGLIAPRPFQAINGITDDLFPIADVRTAYESLRSIYDVLGVGDLCGLYEGQGGHRFYSDGAWPFVREQLARMKADK